MRRLPFARPLACLLVPAALAAGCHAAPAPPAASTGPAAPSTGPAAPTGPVALPPALGAPAVPIAEGPPAAAAAASPLRAAAPAPGAHPPEAPGAPAFATAVRPIFERRCTPCHFPGGKMYDELPFDDPDTLRQLGTRLLGRLDEPDERRTVEAFLASPGGA